MTITKRKRRKRKGHYHRGTYVSSKTGLSCKFRSGWESYYMQHLDSCDDVRTWRYESFSIEYVSNVRTGKTRKYIPDFVVEYVDGTSHVVEIKPLRRTTQAIVKKKLAAAEAWCRANGMTLELITEIELKVLGLLK